MMNVVSGHHYKAFALNAVLFLSLLVAGFSLSGCFGNKAPERSYFSIDYALGTQPKYSTPKYNKTVVIQNVTSALAYDRQEIVYRTNPYEFQYYWYRLWAAKPRKMLPELINGHLRYTNLFKNVSTTIEDHLPDYLLNIEIQTIEELDVSNTEWYAHLSLHLALEKSDDSTNVWTYSFDVRRPVADNQPVYVVKAMSELLDTELVKAFQDLDRKMASIEAAASLAAPVAIDFSESAKGSADSEADAQDLPRATLKNKPEAANN